MAMENKELIEKVKLLQEQALEDNRLCLAELFGNILNAEKDYTSLSDYFISIADDDLKVAVHRKIKGKSYRYNFTTNSWDEKTEITPEKLISVRDFRFNRNLFNKFGNYKINTWSIVKANTCKHLAEVDYQTSR